MTLTFKIHKKYGRNSNYFFVLCC